MERGKISSEQIGILLGGFSEIAQSEYGYLDKADFERIVKNNLDDAEAEKALDTVGLELLLEELQYLQELQKVSLERILLLFLSLELQIT